MTDQERAVALADFAEKDGYIDISATFEEAELRLWIKGMRLLAALPADGDVMERVAGALHNVRDRPYLRQAHAALAALRPGDKIGGMVLVPAEPTEEMESAARAAGQSYGMSSHGAMREALGEIAVAGARAMLAAAKEAEHG